MAKLFKKKDAADLRSVRYPLHLTEKEAETLRHSASIRDLDLSEFIRRAALGRRADVHYETEIVLALIGIAREIRRLHAALVERGITPPENEWRPVILEAISAIKRISK